MCLHNKFVPSDSLQTCFKCDSLNPSSDTFNGFFTEGSVIGTNLIIETHYPSNSSTVNNIILSEFIENILQCKRTFGQSFNHVKLSITKPVHHNTVGPVSTEPRIK
jgi:hypothetical protein